MASRDPREDGFIPPIITPVKMKRARFFAADGHVRESRKVLVEKMPWLVTDVLPDPQSVLAAVSGEPSVFLFDDTGLAILDAKALRSRSPDSVFVLFSFQPYLQFAPPQAAAQKYPYTTGADLVFAVHRDAFPPGSILLPAVPAG